jgi:hypothetical protein
MYSLQIASPADLESPSLSNICIVATFILAGLRLMPYLMPIGCLHAADFKLKAWMHIYSTGCRYSE